MTDSSRPSEYEVFDYSAFEDRFRGPEERIQARQRRYLEHLEGLDGLVFDLGCGRGEFLDLARGAGFRARGVDLNAVHVQRCRDKGLEAEQADGFAVLESLPHDSLAAVASLQTVEHMQLQDIVRLVNLAYARLGPRGVLILETPNPYNADARLHFWKDPTHVRPIYPELLEFLAESAGFERAEIHYLGEEVSWRAVEWRDRRKAKSAMGPLGRLRAKFSAAGLPRVRSHADLAAGRLLDQDEGSAFPDYYLLARKAGVS